VAEEKPRVRLRPLNTIQKCDVKRPCTTRISAKTASECVYDHESRPQPAGTDPSHRSVGHPSGQQPTGPDPVGTPTATPSHSPGERALGVVLSPAKLDLISSTSSGTRGQRPTRQLLHKCSGLTRLRMRPSFLSVGTHSSNASPWIQTAPSLPSRPASCQQSLLNHEYRSRMLEKVRSC
jgi:hypothetical protein